MAEGKRAAKDDPAEGSRETVEHELRRGKQESNPDEKIAIPTPIEPGDPNAQTTPS